MLKGLFLTIGCSVWLSIGALAGEDPEQQAMDEWTRLKGLPVTEGRFHEVCDLLQGIGRTNINLSYRILAEYAPIVRATGNREWLHVLLMGWAKAKESLDYFAEADSLYRAARENAIAATGNPRLYNESLVGTVLLYAEWGRQDSLEKYAAMGETAAQRTKDRENLSFIYTFRAVSHPGDTAGMGRLLRQAIDLAATLPDKNALFTARYNYAVIYWQQNPQKQVVELGTLLELIRDRSLDHKPKLYERTAFTFRNPGPSIYYQLMQVNLLLRDYDNAWKFAELFYDATVRPNPKGVQAPYFNAEMAIVKAYQGDFAETRKYIGQSLALFAVPEEKIPYPSYFLAKGMLAEHEGRLDETVRDYEIAWRKGATEGLHMVPSGIFYAHGLILARRLAEAERVLGQLRQDLPVRTYSAFGYYYYKDYAELLKAKGDLAGYAKALELFYSINDSLTNLNHYRAIEEIGARVRLRDKERQIADLNQESLVRQRNARRERTYFIIFLSLSLLVLLLLIAYAYTLYQRRRQSEQLARQKERLRENQILEMEKQHRIDVMQGAMNAGETERRKIADRLHDEVGSLLSLATLNISSTLEKGREDKQSDEKLEKAQSILSSVSTTIRDISHQLTPLIIEKYGLRKAVEELADTVNLSGKLRLRALIVGFDGKPGYPASFLHELYRILQELVHNILKHAEAGQATLELVEHPEQVSVMVEDDGVGISENVDAKGKGLGAIRSKIAYFQGQIEITRKKDRGTLIVIELPTGHWHQNV
ncbi:MAG: ATP-binding protein [Bacteroidota bacterium]|nr:ATP-binding protein [Bacteroidota bacterium]MDP4216762.1 ATP-binding protein [Bacteroidota bacterium]MDP4247171.1 ATP-binding protein [Bacteroidota bacterium]MDP4255191.1 ATP-binding protein [Bacteroidota bacterium]MDP4257481.1 ATP-binding protein [Bacteroidota bacterium]